VKHGSIAGEMPEGLRKIATTPGFSGGDPLPGSGFELVW
jgi:hypothetical protein